MNILVVGLGSMGRRRIRLIQKYSNSYNITGIDFNDQRRQSVGTELSIETESSLKAALKLKKADCAFICTSPLSHASIINECLQANLHIFTELNLVVDEYDDNIKLAKERGRILFLSSTFLHRAETKKINQLVHAQNKMLNYTYHIGQYLPDWHPWESYRNFFVADKRTNGCREILAIELPWLTVTFGEIKDIVVRKSKNSGLNIDYNDNYLLMIEHQTGHKGVLAVDIISRKAVRNLEVFGEELYLSWDGSPKGLQVMNLVSKEIENVILYQKIDQMSQYSEFVVENAYYEEVVAFFDSINGKCEPVYSFQKDKEILKLIDEIEV